MNKKNTLKTSTALRWIALLFAAALFAGCSLTGETIRDRIDKFITAINNQDPQGIKRTVWIHRQPVTTQLQL